MLLSARSIEFSQEEFRQFELGIRISCMGSFLVELGRLFMIDSATDAEFLHLSESEECFGLSLTCARVEPSDSVVEIRLDSMAKQQTEGLDAALLCLRQLLGLVCFVCDVL